MKALLQPFLLFLSLYLPFSSWLCWLVLYLQSATLIWGIYIYIDLNVCRFLFVSECWQFGLENVSPACLCTVSASMSTYRSADVIHAFGALCCHLRVIVMAAERSRSKGYSRPCRSHSPSTSFSTFIFICLPVIFFLILYFVLVQ